MGRFGMGPESLMDEVLEIDAVEDLMEGNVGGFIEDEILEELI